MKAKTVRWLVAAAFSATLVGCGDRGERAWADKVVETRAPQATQSAAAAVASASSAPTVTPVKPATDKPARAKSDGDRLEIQRLVLSTGVKNREPVDAATTFPVEQDRVYAFLEVENPDRTESAVFVSFVPPKGAEHGPIELEVGAAPRWRTWAYTRAAKRPGTWKAVVKNASGKVLAETEFHVGAADDPYEPPTAPAKPGA